MLHITVADVLSMSHVEYTGWLEYLRRRPIGWREDQRTALLLTPHTKKLEADKIFPSLHTIYEEQRGREEYEKRKARTSPFIHMLRSVSERQGSSGWLDFIDEKGNGKSNSNRNTK